jgi:hypothetical protein
MAMDIKVLDVGDLGADSYVASKAGTDAHFQSLRKVGLKFFIGYLGHVTPERLKSILQAGLDFMPVTLGMAAGVKLDGALGASWGSKTVAHCQKLGLPLGVTTWLDLEGAPQTPSLIMSYVREWAKKVSLAGFNPGLYVGAGAQLSSSELYSLPVYRYWQSLSRETSMKGEIVEPACGWCAIQLYPSVTVGGVLIDYNVIQKDYKGRLPVAVRGCGKEGGQ